MKYISPTFKGAIISFILILISLASFYGLHFQENGYTQYVVLATYIVCIAFVLVSALKNNVASTLKDYFTEGFKAFVVVAFFMCFYTYFFHKANPQIMENGILENNAMILKEGNHTQMEIDENAQKLRSVFIPMMLSLNIIKYLFLGAIVSLSLGALLSRKNN